MIKFTSIAIIILLLAGCSTATIPLQANINSIEVKIENAKSGRRYNLFSSLNEGIIDSKTVDANETAYFDISKSKEESGKCFFVSDEKNNIVPINDKYYKFSNPAYNRYVTIKNKLENEYSSISKEQNLLNNNPANRNGMCALLTVGDIPSQPFNACSPQEETYFTSQQCQNVSNDSGVATKIGNSLACAGAGSVVSSINPILGIVTGVACDLIMDNKDEKNQRNKCLNNSLSDCQFYYNNWIKTVNDIKNNPENLRQQCMQSKQKIELSTVVVDSLVAELNASTKSWTLISENNYCY